MDRIASVLLEFPPVGAQLEGAQYNQAAVQHAKNVEKLLSSQELHNYAHQLIDHVHPTDHTISYLGLLVAAHDAGRLTPEDLLTKITTFACTFDSRQIRYFGKHFSAVLGWISSGTLFPASVAVELLTTALLRLDPSGSMFTSHHLALVKLAYTTDNIDAALPILEKDIVFYPSGKKFADSRPPCDPDVPPVGYITVESGLTQKVSSSDVMQYDLLRGLAFIQRRAWRAAFEALERVVTYPVKDSHACSKIMVEAHNKWILVGLLLNGHAPALPPTTSPGPAKAYTTLSKPYLALARAFEERTPDNLRAEFDAVPANVWTEENNLSLVRLVIRHYQRWQILNMRHVYTKIPLSQIRARTQSAETGAPLATDAEVEDLVGQMIQEGMLRGVVEHPDNGEPYLRFLDEAEGSSSRSSAGAESGEKDGEGTMTEAEFAARMAEAAQRIKGLEPLVRAANERLGKTKEYIRFLVKEQKEKERAERGAAAGQEYVDSFMAQVEDEDLMMGVASKY